MSQPILLPISGEMIPLLAQDRRSASNWTQALTLVLSLLVIAATLYQMRAIDPHQIVSLVPVTLHFWALFALGIMAGPLSEFYIFNKLWIFSPFIAVSIIRSCQLGRHNTVRLWIIIVAQEQASSDHVTWMPCVLYL